MSDRLPSDSDAVETLRAEIIRLGSTRLRCLRLPEELTGELSTGDFVRVVLDGTERHARVETDANGPIIRALYETKAAARAQRGDNALAPWLAGLKREEGDGVAFDRVVSGQLYGIREPGKRAVYTVRQGPRDSLASIAEKLDGN
ncbi:DUF7112 family protein [Natronocalculus amylovorans]|uniref:Uncharacterized protein n=1 Tax=Natronocalculus amylovorans TaxID=2917812 RepID=A0AAE3FWY2_9EURY|nr:hypothetical protein [Natronocalculus amylovorans]MCL9816877.1 hypothetical protein [Natronocalculus amylovorans]NUE01318.1 hypothetical protein [Halorubraceae archaeon YAN]